MIKIDVNMLIGKDKPTTLTYDSYKMVEQDKEEIAQALNNSGIDTDPSFTILINCSYFNDGYLKIKISNANPDQHSLIHSLLKNKLKKKFSITPL